MFGARRLKVRRTGDKGVFHSKRPWIIIIGLIVTACGYRFAEEGGFPGQSERIFVKVLENRTQETGVENILTAALLAELTLRKTRHLAGRIDEADVVLNGVIKQVTINTISVSKPTVADERRVSVTLDLQLTHKDGSTAWAAKSLTDFQEYRVNLNAEITDANRRNAIRQLSRRIAERVVNRFSDDF